MEPRIGIILDELDLRQMLKEVGFSVAIDSLMGHTAGNLRLVQRLLREYKKGVVGIDLNLYHMPAFKKYVLYQLDSLDMLLNIVKPQDTEEEDERMKCVAAALELRAELLMAFEEAQIR